MTKKDIIYLVAVIILIIIGFFGFVSYNNVISEFKEKNLVLKNENNKIGNELKIVKKALNEFKSRRKDTHLIYTLLRKSTFNQELYNTSLISLAILLNDKEICDDISGTDAKLCKDVFENRCDKYEYPNREICANLNTMLDRKITPTELISNCNNKKFIENDMSQTQCLQYFAKITNNINLCNEICKTPIDNTNCKAYGRDSNNELKPYKKLSIQKCIDYVLDKE